MIVVRLNVVVDVVVLDIVVVVLLWGLEIEVGEGGCYVFGG